MYRGLATHFKTLWAGIEQKEKDLEAGKALGHVRKTIYSLEVDEGDEGEDPLDVDMLVDEDEDDM